jgi:hypothetical protein
MGVPTTEAEVDAAEGLGSAAWIRSTTKIDGIREIKKQRRSIGKAFLGKAFTTTLRIVLGNITSLFQKRLSCQTAEENDPDLICSLSVTFSQKNESSDLESILASPEDSSMLYERIPEN